MPKLQSRAGVQAKRRQPVVEEEPSSTKKCPHCSESFAFLSELILHQSTHKSKVQCQVCSKKVFRDQLDQHMQVHLSNKAYVCDFCGDRHATKHLLLTHMRSHVASKRFDCAHCGRGFNDKRHFNNHLLTHDDDQPFKCDLCPLKYTRKQLLEFHIVGHHQTERKLQCSACDFSTTAIAELRHHRLDHLKKFVCTECGREFKERRFLRLHHQAVHVKSLDFQCLACDKKFVTEKYVKRHLRAVHKTDTTRFAVLKEVKATIDSQGRVRKVEVPEQPVQVAHESSEELKLEVKVEPDQIEEPSVEPPAVQRLSFSSCRAQNLPPAERTFSCSACSLTFEHQSSLLMHEMQHRRSEEAKHVCSTCGRKFDDQFMLEVHINVKHVTVRTYACKKCDFSTKSYAASRVHRLSHRMAVAHRCVKCKQKFESETLLREHTKAAHVTKDYFCEICGRCFKTELYAKRHLKTVHATGHVECQYCHNFFRSRGELNKHIGNLWKIKKCSGLVNGS